MNQIISNSFTPSISTDPILTRAFFTSILITWFLLLREPWRDKTNIGCRAALCPFCSCMLVKGQVFFLLLDVSTFNMSQHWRLKQSVLHLSSDILVPAGRPGAQIQEPDLLHAGVHRAAVSMCQPLLLWRQVKLEEDEGEEEEGTTRPWQMDAQLEVLHTDKWINNEESHNQKQTWQTNLNLQRTLGPKTTGSLNGWRIMQTHWTREVTV